MEVADVLSLVPREPDKTGVEGMDIEEMAYEYKKRGPAFTGFWGGVPMVCAGIIVFWNGLGEGWAYTSPLVNQHPLAFHRLFTRAMDAAAKEAKLRRLQVAVAKSHTVSRSWLGRMGFLYESDMPEYGPNGETFLRYVKFFAERSKQCHS